MFGLFFRKVRPAVSGQLPGEAIWKYSLTYCTKFGKRLCKTSVFCPKTTDCTNRGMMERNDEAPTFGKTTAWQANAEGRRNDAPEMMQQSARFAVEVAE